MTSRGPSPAGLPRAELLEWKDRPASARRESVDIALGLSLIAVAAVEAVWFAVLGYLIYTISGSL
jgi:hypothetical protein